MRMLPKWRIFADPEIASPEKAHPGDMLLAEFFDKHFYPHAEATRRRPRIVKYVFDRHMRSGLGQIKLADLSSFVLDEWIRAQINQRYKPGAINKHIFLVNRMLNVAQNWGLIDKNIFQNCLIERLPLGDYKQHFLTATELRTLLTACAREPHPYLELFAKLLILTGARSSEARLSLWSHYDLEARIWTVPVSKNGRSRRIVLSTAALALLGDIRAKTESLMLPTGWQDHLFINPRLKRPYDSFHAAWDRARRSVAMPTVRIHDLRHTYASLLINNGASIYEVQTLLGHHNVSMTQRYAHLAPNTLQTRVEMVAGLLD